MSLDGRNYVAVELEGGLVCAYSSINTPALNIAEVLEPELKSSLRTSLTGSLDHRLELGSLPKSASSSSFHRLAGSNNFGTTSSKFGSIRNIKVSSTLIRPVYYHPRNIREEAKSIS